MSLSPAVLDAMLSAGCSAEQIVAVVKADMVERERAADERRAKDAERQRRHRASRDVTVTVCDEHDSPLPLSSPQTPQQTPTPAKTNPARVRGTRLTESWKPGSLTGEAGKIAALRGSEWVGLELVKFRNHWIAKSGQSACKADWQRTWANWIIQANEWRPGQQPRAGPAAQQSDFAALMKQAERYRATAA